MVKVDKKVIDFVEEKFKIYKEEVRKLVDANTETIRNNQSIIDVSIEQGKQRDKKMEGTEAKIIEYVNGRHEANKNDFKEELIPVMEMFEKIEAKIQECNNKISELETQQSKVTTAEKYSLTKAKLIRLMKDMGYYK